VIPWIIDGDLCLIYLFASFALVVTFVYLVVAARIFVPVLSSCRLSAIL